MVTAIMREINKKFDKSPLRKMKEVTIRQPRMASGGVGVSGK